MKESYDRHEIPFTAGDYTNNSTPLACSSTKQFNFGKMYNHYTMQNETNGRGEGNTTFEEE